MAKIKYYKVVIGCTEKQLESRVNNCLEAGYEPIGGVSVCVQDTENMPYTYAQAVVDYYDD